jgi:hypothetical protein
MARSRFLILAVPSLVATAGCLALASVLDAPALYAVALGFLAVVALAQAAFLNELGVVILGLALFAVAIVVAVVSG